MNQAEYKQLEAEFLATVDLVRLEAYAVTGYEWMVVPGSGANRSIKEQHLLYIQPTDGRDNDHDGLIDEADERVTRADGGQSPHNFNLGRDIVPCRRRNEPWWEAPGKLWMRMGEIAERHGLVWGGHFKSIVDLPHVEHPRWRAVKTAWKNGEVNIA